MGPLLSIPFTPTIALRRLQRVLLWLACLHPRRFTFIWEDFWPEYAAAFHRGVIPKTWGPRPEDVLAPLIADRTGRSVEEERANLRRQRKTFPSEDLLINFVAVLVAQREAFLDQLAAASGSGAPSVSKRAATDAAPPAHQKS